MLNVEDTVPTESLSFVPELASRTWRVLFFFPRAATTHCQMQARRFESLNPDFQALGVQIVGASSDTRPQHSSFRDLCRVTYPLVADPSGELGRAFGVLEDEVVDGENNLRAKRVTFVLSPDHRVVKRYDDVDPDAHASIVLEDLQSLLRSPPR
ncbi:peroxiredoxin [Deinococcus yavapaiensis]|uniref:thioredoxin-dependent peroxiredoxin n=1 Tax=Deinococcus yavapaiensis KR-236 TaxID=694435 RepID=A0A318SAL3_9DEIO|nr:redoxin domain-containing protein [Deinococcus yavapaiensis]PYE55250.1 peroxiredoxin Q/BCP [Deinococcus yavapaiensis KR-236]